jgi:hypothetical protein
MAGYHMALEETDLPVLIDNVDKFFKQSDKNPRSDKLTI